MFKKVTIEKLDPEISLALVFMLCSLSMKAMAYLILLTGFMSLGTFDFLLLLQKYIYMPANYQNIMSKPYLKIPTEDNESNSHNDRHDSFELDSLASSDGDDFSQHTASSRGLSPLGSPINNDDSEREAFMNENDYLTSGYNTRQSRANSASTLGDVIFNIPSTRDLRSNLEVPLEKQKRLSLLNGLSLVIGLQIGSGIFASPTQVDLHAGSVGTSLIVWAIAGLLAWTGASSYAELGTAIPLNGSSQAYLNHIFGPLPSFLFAWTGVTVLKPGGAAIIALVFGEYFARSLCISFLDTYWGHKIFAILGLALVTGINCFSTRLGARTSNVFLVLKIVLILALPILGVVGLTMKHDEKPALTSNGLFEGASKNLGDYAIALYAGLWAYDGWDNVNYVAAEMKNARRDVPRVIHIAMPMVIIAYLVANLSYYAVLTKEEITASTTLSVTFAKKLLGKAGGIIFALFISFSCLGALNASVFTAARLIYTSAKDEFMPGIFGHTHEKTNTPVNSLLLQAGLTAFFVVIGEFKSLLTFYGIAGYLFYFLTVFGVIVLRIKEPLLDRPYKTFITTPILFCCVALFLVLRTVVEKPLESIYALLFIALGVPIYIWKFGISFKKLFSMATSFKKF